MILLAVSAQAQSVPNGDFEDRVLGWTDISTECFDSLDGLPPVCWDADNFGLDGSVARGTQSGLLSSAYDMGIWWLYAEALSEPFVVTRTQLSWAQSGSAGSAWLLGYSGSLSAGPPSTDAFSNWQRNVQAACGQTAQVRLLMTDGSLTWFDEVALSGSVCPDFLDADLDGLCPRGTDVDADGDCADDGELVGADCDDSDAAIGMCLDLQFGRWLEAGEKHRFNVSGAAAGDTLWLVSAEASGSSCPSALGGVCTDLAEPVTVLGSVTADAAGEATARAQLPSWTTFQPRLFQVVAAQARSPVEEGWIVPADDTPWKRSAPGVYNGDMEDEHGWPPASQGMYSYASGIDYTCPPPDYVSEPARGSSALRVGHPDRFYAEGCDGLVRGWPLLVTRTGLRWATVGDLEIEVVSMEDETSVPLDVAGPVLASDGFEEFGADLSAACGEVVWIELSHGWGADPVVVDNVRLVGPPCGEYLDPDGNGRCPSGRDRDGDGACVSRGEPDKPPAPPELPVERLVTDLEAGTPWVSTLTDAEAAPHHTRGDTSGYVNLEYTMEWLDLPGEVVTHDTFVLYTTTLGVGDWPYAELSYSLLDPSYDYLASVTVPIEEGPGVWAQHPLDVSASCGQPFEHVELSLYWSNWWYDQDGPTTFHHADMVLFDDLGFAGAPCPTLVDSNGNGACREGLDLDGDGLCVDTGEPTPGVVHDPTE